MNLTPEQLEAEKSYLKQVLKVLNETVNKNDESIQGQMEHINEMKKYIWTSLTEMDDTEIADGMYEVNSNVAYANNRLANLQKLKKSIENPYFGRIDFKSDKSKSSEVKSIYVGLNSINQDLDHYVFDWRTPIASLFYNYGTGKASYEAPAGTINGEITLKRQYKIANGKIERCFDSDLNIDDDYLQEILSTASSEKMTNIVNTIQKEQNEIIRNVVDKYLIVQGIAGSGKTSVALHRIAYLLYEQKDLTSNNVLIFSPNNVFSEYISNVLPELGEENVLQTTFSDFSKSYIKDYKNIESFTEFIERYYKKEDNNVEEFNIIKFKLSNEFMAMLDTCINEYKKSISFERGLNVNGRIVTKHDLNQMFHEKLSRLPLPERLDILSENLCDTGGLPYKYKKEIRKKLNEMINGDLSIKNLYQNIISSDTFKELAGLKENTEFKRRKKLSFEDLIPLMYLNFEINGYPRGNTIKHVIIDEAQDYSLLQLKMLKRIFDRASFTILGDIHQTINPYYMYDNLNEINSIFDNKGKYIELNKTYRSSEEIIQYTNKILGIDNACSVRKSNTIPVVLEDVDREKLSIYLKNEIETMKANGMKKIAIITKNNKQTLDIYNELKEQIEDLSLVDEKVPKGITDVVVLPSYISKGLEFDGVIAYTDDKHHYQEKDKYLFYVVCTRAQHSLTVYNQKTLVKGKNR
ncbi:MAG: AAA family ATPase [Bacilli bacterium]|nr:AAA family ATPase [Bacilli bacterium]